VVASALFRPPELISPANVVSPAAGAAVFTVNPIKPEPLVPADVFV
jgi:hypothetical protein